MVLRSAIVLLALLVFLGACASERLAQEGTEEQGQSGEIERPQPMSTVRATPSSMPAPPCAGNEESDNLCEPRDVSGVTPIPGGTAGAGFDVDLEIPSVEELLEKGLHLAEASPVHLAIRGTPQADSIRCERRGVARTLTQREEAIRFWLAMDDAVPLPSASEVERQFMIYVREMGPSVQASMESGLTALARGGLTNDFWFITCYVNYTTHDYLLGDGPGEIIIGYDTPEAVWSYGLYRRAHASRMFGNDALISEGEHQQALQEIAIEAESALAAIIGGRESVVFLAPTGAHNAIAIEAWQAVAQWDLQTDDEDVVHAVRYGVPENDPEYTQTLANLVSRVETASDSDAFADDRLENADELDDYYDDIGAYDDITPDDGETATFTPAQPPEVPTCANGTAVTDPEDNRELVHDCEALLEAKDALRGTATLDWAASSAIIDWEGVTTSGTPTRVTELDLSSKSLTGTIPAELGTLFKLTMLDLSSNSLTGDIPHELGWLYNLDEIRLSGNSLTGCIPIALEPVATNDFSFMSLLYCQPPAPENLSAGTALERSIPLTWDTVSNTSKYRVEYRLWGDPTWTVDDEALTGTSHTVDELTCESLYHFRVSAYGSGAVYAAAWGEGTLLFESTEECTDLESDEDSSSS